MIRNIILGLVTVFVSVGGFAENISCPVALWDDMSALFEPGEPLELPGRVKAYGGSVSESDGVATVCSDKGADSVGGSALSVKEDFAAMTAARSVMLSVPERRQPSIKKETDGVGLWIKTAPYVYLSFQYEDAAGRTFSIPAHRQKTSEWEFAGAPLKSVVIFADHKRGKVQLPAKLTGIELSTAAGDFSFDFTAKMKGLQRISRPDEDQPQRVKTEIVDPPFGLVYRPGQTVSTAFSAPDKNGEVRWEFVEYGGKVIDKGSAPGTVNTEQILEQAGHYRFLVELIEDGKRTDYRVLSLAVIEENPPVHDRVGLCGHWSRPYYTLETLDLLPLIGVSRLRDHLAWQVVEKSPGEMEVTRPMAEFLKEARRRGITGLTILNGFAQHYGGGVPHTPEAIAAFLDYCRFMADADKGVFERFELWNEWSNGTGMEEAGFEPTPENYAWLAGQVIPELRKTLPDAEFIGLGGENPYRFEHEIIGMLQAGAGKYFDSISLHPYRQPFPPEIAHTPESEPVDETMKKFAALSKQYGGPGKIQITEIGYPVFRMGWGVNEVEQARYMVRTLALLHSIPEVDDVYWYALCDELDIPLRGNAPTSISFAQHGYGLFRDKRYSYAPKPAAVAMATYARLTAGGVFGPVQRPGNGVFRLDVSEPDGTFRCAMLWTVKGEAELSVQGDRLKAVTLTGRSHPVTDGQLTVSQDVIYLIGDLISLKDE
jgi:hypothetical protein